MVPNETWIHRLGASNFYSRQTDGGRLTRCKRAFCLKSQFDFEMSSLTVGTEMQRLVAIDDRRSCSSDSPFAS